ncbi:NAD(P)-binding protein [Pisolithus orientalis]|uniref:NAD(P)-binding protein n=1 Tax=Pisolithus orientalis TaxID=936130 RepID=UPI002224FA22|nr:NAD(P)-binding protein [Pisolithus orientalis]KAI6035255.1 NAD(P)-binding protein [Pisolithus orientalis]
MTAAAANESKQLVTLAVVGCGQRGEGYASYALKEPYPCKVVAIAEPRKNTCRLFAQAHNVDAALVFNHWQDLLQASAETIETLGRRLADGVIVAVQDNMHRDVVMAFAAQGYHILCEKPMAITARDCFDMEAAVKKAGIIFGMGHVLRYSPYTKAITEIIRSGTLGELVNAVHVEPVGYYHFAHSYVRGNWAKETGSSFSLLTKSCHDIDILCHWLLPATPIRVSSFGSLYHFKKGQKPAAASGVLRCLQCPVERECPYSAKKIYLDAVCRGHISWPVSVLVDGVPDIENVTYALQHGPYGQCVYESDNDVCDHQVVNIEFSSGATASFTMVAHTSLICERQTRLHFTNGEIVGDMSTFTVTDFRTGRKTRHYPNNEGGGHGGGDLGLVSAFVEAVRSNNQACLDTNVSEILKSHLTVFAAESSRREGRVVDCAEYEKGVRMALVA